ncbi:hypothetical protein ILYODFUR_008101 [Ilyodon furcidens]|uniref:Uncharacterized protein n=1 Tax=Ilyodon furcidens TaxID=33524 RepID=A0ABV0UEF6_9TELE
MENKMLKKERKYDPPILLLCSSTELFVLFYHQRLSVKVYWDEVMESLPTVIVFCVSQVQGNSICCLKSDSLHVMLGGSGFCQWSDDDQLCDRFFSGIPPPSSYSCSIKHFEYSCLSWLEAHPLSCSAVRIDDTEAFSQKRILLKLVYFN